MEQKTGNTFGGGFKKDVSDFVLKNNQIRFGYNIRVFNQEGSNYVVSNITGTEEAFQLTNGFIPVGCEEHNNILYLVSWNNITKEIEVGSYPSPDYGDNETNNKYRPFNNIDNLPFRTASFGLAMQPIVDVQIQDDYDKSVNIVFTLKDNQGHIPRIVNSRFKIDVDLSGNKTYTELLTRPGNANSNSYTALSVEKETRLVISSDKILGIDLIGIQTGGKLKPGNYIYVFQYMTEDFNTTVVSGQSSVCQIFFGNSPTSIKGGDETKETDKRVAIALSNIDIDFKYLKVYVLYSAGQEGVYQQYLEFTNPISITGENMSFFHTGYEELAEVSQDTINIEYGNLSGVDTITEINGYLLSAGIKEFSYSLIPFRQFAAGIVPSLGIKALSSTGAGGYMNTTNTYNYLGYFGKESYALAVVFILPGGVMSPAFPTKGIIINSTMSGSTPIPDYYNQDNGIVTFPGSNRFLPYDLNQIQVKHLKMNISNISLIANGVTQGNIDYVKENTIGFFFVRGERIPSLLTQGILIPTFKAPTDENFNTDADVDNTYYAINKDQIDNTTFFKHLPLLDSLVEAHNVITRDDGGHTTLDREVVDANNKIKDGYMPSTINDWIVQGGSAKEILYSKQGENFARHWALISGEALLNEPEFNNSLQRENISLQQIAKINSFVQGEITPMLDAVPFSTRTGLWYEFSNFLRYPNSTIKNIAKIVHVPGETFITGSDFISRIRATMHIAHNTNNQGPDQEVFISVDQNYNSYFGVEMENSYDGYMTDSIKSVDMPIAGNTRMILFGVDGFKGQAKTAQYNNLGKTIPASFLVSIYPAGGPTSGANLYPTIDNISYRQITKRYKWSDVTAVTHIDVFGGDAYISKIHHKLNQSRYRNPSELISDEERRSNIDAGIMISWYQESKYNLALRQPKKFDDSELTERSFFPYEGKNDFDKFRSYRYPETLEHSKGYSEILTPKGFYIVPVNTPFLENEFYSRVYASDKHIPNAFRNGFRRITNNFKDYTSSLGRIVRLFNHRGKMLIIFENGIALGEIEQRIQTGNDISGDIFVLVKEILPPTLGYPTQELGSQQFYSMVQSPSAVYGYDAIRRKIWQIRDGFKVISDDGFSSFLEKNPISNMRSGYDPENNEVTFTSDNWTLCFKEGQETFNSFYSFRPDFYARRGNDFYSFKNAAFHRHNASVFTIYGEGEDSIVEFVVNDKLNVTKVLDSLELISNEIAPNMVEVFTYNQTTEKLQVLVTSSMNQYVQILNENDSYTLAPKIKYRNKAYQVKLPLVKIYNGGSADDRWGVKGRMTNIYFIIRLTYRPNMLLQLATIVSSYRYSAS